MAKIDFGGGGAGAVNFTGDDMLRWCAEKNEWAARIKFERWWFVSKSKDTGQVTIACVDGLAATEVWRLAGGWRPDYRGWSEIKLSDHERHLRWYLNQGSQRQAVMV